MESDAVPDPLADDRESRLDAAIAAYHEAAESGPAPDLGAWISQFPDLAPDLEEYFRSVGLFDALIGAAARDPTHEGNARIGLQVARGLAHAHQRGVLHRDVKPSNLLLDRPGGGYVRLLDRYPHPA